MQKSKQAHNITFIGVESALIESIKTELANLKSNDEIHAVTDTNKLESSFATKNIELVVFSQSNDFSLNALIALITASNKDIPIIIAYDEADYEQQLSDSKSYLVRSFILKSQPALAARLIQQELKNLENRRRRLQAEYYLQETEKRCRSLLSESQKATAFLNREHRFIYVNDSFAEMLNYSIADTLLGKNVRDIISPSHAPQLDEIFKQLKEKTIEKANVDLPLNTQNQTDIPFNLNLQKARFERTKCIEVGLNNASGQIAPVKPNEDDHLTGLKNQLYLLKQLEREITNNTSSNETSYLIYIKPEQSDPTSDTDDFGLQDSILRLSAKTLKSIINRSHTLVRYQENAFCVLFSNPDQDKAKILAEQIHQALADEPINVNGVTIKLEASIGIAPIGADSFDPNMVISLAMSSAAEVKNGISVYGVEEVLEDSVTSEELQDAVAKGQLKLLFQPVVSLCAEQKSYYEVLLRMLDENNNQISPNEFINMLNHDDVSLELDRWVISDSIQQLAKTKANNSSHDNTLFINLTGRTIDDPQFAPWLAQSLSKAGIGGESLIFQFSEADIASHKENINRLIASLQKLKAQICIKHFGSTIDSDSVLNKVEAKFIKLDGSFIQELGDKSKHETFDRLIEPIKNKHKTIIAPLVEDTSVISKLFMCGIGYIQGYYLQAPREQMDYDFFQE